VGTQQKKIRLKHPRWPEKKTTQGKREVSDLFVLTDAKVKSKSLIGADCNLAYTQRKRSRKKQFLKATRTAGCVKGNEVLPGLITLEVDSRGL